ncbi:MAG: hypothetical protein AAB413_01095 [Patescibacteria group bacterium]
MEHPMPTETTDNGAKSVFVFPSRPEDAVVHLVINVRGMQGDGLLLSASTIPGSQTWEHDEVEQIFRDSRTVPIKGVYVLETNNDGTNFVITPEGVDQDDRRALVWTLSKRLDRFLIDLIKALRAFPSAEVIDQAAREGVARINMGSLERDPMGTTPVVDARNVVVEGVKCVHCGFGIESALGQFPGRLLLIAAIDDDSTTVGNLKFIVRERDGQPVVLVGYLGDKNAFAAFLNGELAQRVRAAIQAVAVEVVTEILVRAENGRRQFERMVDSVQATYGIDPEVVVQRVNELEAEARAQRTPPEDKVDDYDGNEDDLLDEEPAGDPAPESAAPAEPAPAPVEAGAST